MAGSEKGDKLEKFEHPVTRAFGSTGENSGENDNLEATYSVPAPSYEVTLAAIFMSTNQRIDNIQATLISNQECQISKLKAGVCMEMAELRAKMSNLQDGMTFMADEIKELKSQISGRPAADTSVATVPTSDLRTLIHS